jgi:hypothetical protein
MMLCKEVCRKCCGAISGIYAAHFDRLWGKGQIACSVKRIHNFNTRYWRPPPYECVGYYRVVYPPPLNCPYELEHVINNNQSNPAVFDSTAPWIPPVLKKLHKAINELDWEDYDYDNIAFSDLGCPCILCRIARGETGFDDD